MNSNKSDYLKYWRTVRQYIKVKYKINIMDLEMLLFLYSEPHFTKNKFADFNKLLSWDTKRFERMREAGWIDGTKTYRTGRRTKYFLSFKAKRMIDEIYHILDGDEMEFEEKGVKFFKRNVRYNDTLYQNFLMKMRKMSTKQPRHLSPE